MSLARSVSNAELFPPPELQPTAVIMHTGSTGVINPGERHNV